MTERAVARIDLGAVERNCTRLPKPLCAVVKAEGYGHGVRLVAEAALAGGATWLAVATAAEAAELRQLVPPEVPVLVMGAVTRDELRVAVEAEADMVLQDDQGDLHLPHYVNLFGGTVFLESLHRYEGRLRKAFASSAEDMMTRDPDTVGPDTSVRDAARLIHESGHNRLPVVEDGRLVGVVTRLDILGALAA